MVAVPFVDAKFTFDIQIITSYPNLLFVGNKYVK